MRLDLADLRLFLAIVDAGSITHGASAANLSAAAASERLREMEASSGVLLVERGQRGVTTTKAGDALAAHARLVLRQVGLLHAEMAKHASGIRAVVKLFANTAAITGLLPERLAQWMAAHPHVDIELTEQHSSEIVKSIVRGTAEIGIVSSAVQLEALEKMHFATDRLVVVLPAMHRLASAREIALSEIVEENHIGFDGALQDHIAENAARSGFKLHPRIRLRTLEGICQIVAAGAGVGIIPEAAARGCRRSMPIALVRMSDAWTSRSLLVCCRSVANLSPIAREVYDALIDAREAAPL